MGKKSKYKKSAQYDLVDMADLDRRAAMLVARGYNVSKWIEFCQEIIRMGLMAGVYEAKSTLSKYVYVIDATQPNVGRFKVRFSNHRPNKAQQEKDDSDFYVGVSNGMVTTTADAIKEVRKRFKVGVEA